MKYRTLLHRACLYFSQWSNKGYSIFIGLGREVRIARLALHMYGNVLLKSSTQGIIVNMDKVSDVAFSVCKWNEMLKLIVRFEEKVYPNDMNIINKMKKGYIVR